MPDLPDEEMVAIHALMTAMLSEGAIKAASDAAMEEAGGMGLHAGAREDAAKAICRCAGKTLLAAIDTALSGKDQQVAIEPTVLVRSPDGLEGQLTGPQVEQALQVQAEHYAAVLIEAEAIIKECDALRGLCVQMPYETAERIEAFLNPQPPVGVEIPEQAGERMLTETEEALGGQFSPSDAKAFKAVFAEVIREHVCPNCRTHRKDPAASICSDCASQLDANDAEPTDAQPGE